MKTMKKHDQVRTAFDTQDAAMGHEAGKEQA